MKEARFYTPADEGVKCLLCPHHCRIREGGRGLCRSRECRDGKLYALSYGRPCALAIDPVEKKPLNHFMPGTRCLSLSCTGCNLSCLWCQNSDISQAGPEEAESDEWSPEEIVDAALRCGLPSIAFTYTEPFTWWEYMYDIAAFAHDRGLKNILVSAGYVEREPLEELLPYLDAALCRWMVENGLRDVPLHLSRFFPRYHFTDVGPTPKATLLMARDVALSHGIRTVHLGNI